MELIERSGYLSLLGTTFANVAAGEGHCVFVCGEAGIGKSALVRNFCRGLPKKYPVYHGTCDALFTPRPLAPLYDVLLQAKSDLWKDDAGSADRTRLFTSFLEQLRDQHQTVLLIFEDIHWADEATLDFIKFLSRRIAQLNCLFVLTYRDNEINAGHPLRQVLGQLYPDNYTRIQLPPLSRQAVEEMAIAKGFSGSEVFSISGGIPFYVNEILASYSVGVPDNIKDAVLSVFNRQPPTTREVWELMAVIPTGLEMVYLSTFDPRYADAIEDCTEKAIFLLRNGLLCFKHELYRRTIESSLSPLKRLAINKRILDLLKEHFEQRGETERLIHHAKNANEYDLVVQYAPRAARKAAGLGSHIEASRLYITAITYYQGTDSNLLIELYEAYAYECYLVNKTWEAIIYTGKALKLWKQKKDPEKIGNSLRFLSRLWWFEGNHKNADQFAREAIQTLETQPVSHAKAMALSNMSQLSMLSKNADSCIFWGEQAIAMAKELNNEEILCHALNNVGAVSMKQVLNKEKGINLLKDSLAIALANGYHEHVARAYTNLGSIAAVMKDYVLAKQMLDEGIQYCEERDLDSWTSYMYSWKTRLKLENGEWGEAYKIADNLLKNEHQPAVVKIGTLAVMGSLKMRRGDSDALPLLLEATTKAFDTMELQRIIPALTAALEYEWITGTTILNEADIARTAAMVKDADNFLETSAFAFWMRKARKQVIHCPDVYEGYDVSTAGKARYAAGAWQALGCPYDEALTLFEAGDGEKRTALGIVRELGASAVVERMKMDMRSAGIKSIPRGIRKSTQANTAQLTARELELLPFLKEGLQNKEIAARLFISAKTVDHHISSILFKLDVNSRAKAVQAATLLHIIK